MKPATINHSFRKINFDYYSEEPLSDFENKLIVSYKALHEKVHQLNQHCLKMGASIAGKVEAINEFKVEFDIMESEISKYEMLFGFAEQTLEEGDYKINPKELQDKIRDYSLMVNEYHAGLPPTVQMYAKIFKLHKTVENGFERFGKKFTYPLSANHETMIIDIVVFDQDQNAFREKYAGVEKLFNKYTDAYNEFVDQHNIFMDDIKVFYKRVENIYDHIAKMQSVELKKDSPDFSLN